MRGEGPGQDALPRPPRRRVAGAAARSAMQRALLVLLVPLALAFAGSACAAPADAHAVEFDRAAFAIGDYDGRFGSRWQHEVRLPHAWSRTNPGASGDGWYTIHWDLDALPTTPQALYLKAITVPTEVYVNGILVAASGPLDGRDPRSYEQSRYIDIPADLLHLQTNFIALHVRARSDDVGGLGPVLAGDAGILHEHSRNALVVHTIAPAAIGIATLTVGIFILMLWLRRRDSGYVLFAAGVILWSLHTLVSLVPEPPLPQPHWTIAWTTVYLLFVALLCLFCIRFAGVDWRGYERFVIAYAAAMMPLLYVASVLGRLADATSWVRLGGIAMVIVALFAVARYAVRRRRGVR